MKFIIKQNPFPHIIIDDYYTNDELSLIWQELEFLCTPDKMKDPMEVGSKDVDANGNPLATNVSLQLDSVYTDRNFSNILKINRKLFNQTIIDAINNLSPLLGHINHINKDFTKIKYYHHNTEYKTHYDTARFTAVSYFYKEPKVFSGGDLFFPEYNYTVNVKNNRVVIFIGSIYHASTPVVMQDEYINTFGLGKYTMTQFLNIY